MRPFFAALFFAVSVGPAAGQGADVLLNCSACHKVGPDDAARVPSPYPNLNGQPARYLERQLHAYRMGLRQHPQMQATATALGDGAGAMARLYADAPAPRLTEPSRDAAFGSARKLISEGDWSRGLPPCASCHGIGDDERGRLMPRLHGHPSAYLARQLRAYAEGTRRSDPMGRMRAYAGRLSEAEIAELAEYYAAWGEGQGEDDRMTESEDRPDG